LPLRNVTMLFVEVKTSDITSLHRKRVLNALRIGERDIAVWSTAEVAGIAGAIVQDDCVGARGGREEKAEENSGGDESKAAHGVCSFGYPQTVGVGEITRGYETVCS